MDKRDLLYILRKLKNTADKRTEPGKTSPFEAGYSNAVKHLFEDIKEFDPVFYEELQYYLYCIKYRGISFEEFSEALDMLRE